MGYAKTNRLLSSRSQTIDRFTYGGRTDRLALSATQIAGSLCLFAWTL
jgi:hypothetical protein